MFKKDFLEVQILKYRTDKLKGLNLESVEHLYQQWIHEGGKPLGVDDIYDKYMFLVSCQNRNIPVSLDTLVDAGICEETSYASWAGARVTGSLTKEDTLLLKQLDVTRPTRPEAKKKSKELSLSREEFKTMSQTQEVVRMDVVNQDVEKLINEGKVIKGANLPVMKEDSISEKPVLRNPTDVEGVPSEFVEGALNATVLIDKSEELGTLTKLPLSMTPRKPEVVVPMQLTITGEQEPVMQDDAETEAVSSLEELEDYLRIFNRKLVAFKATKGTMSNSALEAAIRGLKRTSMDVEESMKSCRKSNFN